MTGRISLVSTTTGRVRLSINSKAYIEHRAILIRMCCKCFVKVDAFGTPTSLGVLPSVSPSHPRLLGLPRGGYRNRIRTIYWSNITPEITATLLFRLNPALTSFNLHHKGKLPIEFKFFKCRLRRDQGRFCVLGRVHAVRGLMYARHPCAGKIRRRVSERFGRLRRR